jgi:hypothetical protein
MTEPSTRKVAIPKKPIKRDVDSAELPPYLTLLDEPVSTTRMPSESLSLDAIALNAGWPPRVEGIEAVTRIDPDSPARPFTVALEEALLRTALSHADVQALLKGRWEHLGTYLSSPRNYSDCRHDARLYFHNYTAGYGVEVTMSDCEILSISKQDPYRHPESAIEERQAIALAREDSRLKGRLTGLDGTAILQIPPDDDPTFGHRLLWVMFTEPDNPTLESRTMFTAMVDLDQQRVIDAGKAPCCSAPDANHDSSAEDSNDE